jgi:hypothetical protein
MEPEFKISKPAGWSRFPLYKKIKYYSRCMTEHYSKYVDKLQAKEIVQEMFPKIKVAKVVKVLRDPNDIYPCDLKPHYYLKATHGSGWNICLRDKTSRDIIDIRNTLWTWNKTYSLEEKQYKYITPRFFIEVAINDKYNGFTKKANVFMVRCIYGKPVSIGVLMDSKNYLYDASWNKLDTLDDTLLPPEELPDMLETASILSRPFEFVRVDMYLGKDGIYFSEFTFTPAGGTRVFSLPTEMEMGKSWM